MTSSTVSGNNTGAGGNGGGAGVGGLNSQGHSATGSHGGFAGSGGVGGGLWTSFGTANLTNVTFSGNFTGDGGIGGERADLGIARPRPGWLRRRRRRDLGEWRVWPLLRPAHPRHHLEELAGRSRPRRRLPGRRRMEAVRSPASPGSAAKGPASRPEGRHDTNGTSVYLKNTIIANNGLVSDANCVDSGAAPTNYFDPGRQPDLGRDHVPGHQRRPEARPAGRQRRADVHDAA